MNNSDETADTDNNTIVREYIISTLKALNWHIEEDTVMDNTPVGMKRFTNVIATKDPTASRRVILSAHFDSKYFSSYPQNQVRVFLLHYLLFGLFMGGRSAPVLTHRSL